MMTLVYIFAGIGVLTVGVGTPLCLALYGIRNEP